MESSLPEVCIDQDIPSEACQRRQRNDTNAPVDTALPPQSACSPDFADRSGASLATCRCVGAHLSPILRTAAEPSVRPC